MSRLRQLQVIAGAGTLLVLALVVALFASESSDAQPQFREFSPPNNPVNPRVNHRHEFPAQVRAEAQGNQRGRGTSYSGYVEVSDDSETVSMMIPVVWNDVEFGPIADGDPHSGVRISASSDLVAFEEGTAPGVVLIAVPAGQDSGASQAQLERASSAARASCGASARHDYVDPFFSGHYDFYRGCTRGGTQIVLNATNGTGQASVLIHSVIQSDADLAAVNNVFDSFQILGTPGFDEDHEHDEDLDH